jgi:hypothetical protein
MNGIDVWSLPADEKSRGTRAVVDGMSSARSQLWLITGAGVRVGKTSLATALCERAREAGRRVMSVSADLGVRSLRECGPRMVERLQTLRGAADVIVIDCAGERETLLLAADADAVVLVTTGQPRALCNAATRARQLGNAGVKQVRVVVSHVEDREAGQRAFSMLCSMLDLARIELVLGGVIVTTPRRNPAAPSGGRLALRAGAAQWTDAALRLLVDGRLDEVSGAPEGLPLSGWRRIWRAVGVA